MRLNSYKITHSRSCRLLIILSVVIAIPLIICGCGKKLVVNEGDQTKVEIRFDWSNVKGAIPKDMSIWFFPKNPKNKNYKAVRRDISVVQGGSAIVTVPIGEYDVICVNNDPERLEYQNDSNPYEFQVVIKGDESAGKKIQRKGGNTRGEADRPMGVWCDCTSNHDFVLSAETYQIMLKPEAISIVTTVDLSLLKRIGDVKSMTGAMLDVCYIYLPYEKRVVREKKKSMFFKMDINTTTRKINGNLQIFNNESRGDCVHLLELYCTLFSGLKYTYIYNITQEIHQVDFNEGILLKNENFTLPVGQDFKFPIKDWGEIDINFNS